MSLSMNNMSNNLESEIDDLRETIIKEVGLQLANLTDELNALKRKQNELIDLVDYHDHSVDVLSTFLVKKYVTYAEAISNSSLTDLVGILLHVRTNFSQYDQNATNFIKDELSLKLHPIDGNLKKV